jgi:hypothetical protein
VTTPRAALLVVALASAACGEPVEDAAPLGDYTTWHRVDTYGDIPAHKDTYRIIYVNDIARMMGTTTKDAVLVKEVHDRDGDAPGALRYIAIMRKLRAGPDPADEGGWLFSQADEPNGDEVHHDSCWARCHVQAPLAGVWLDYTQ